jgi:hypothetical protein
MNISKLPDLTPYRFDQKNKTDPVSGGFAKLSLKTVAISPSLRTSRTDSKTIQSQKLGHLYPVGEKAETVTRVLMKFKFYL